MIELPAKNTNLGICPDGPVETPKPDGWVGSAAPGVFYHRLDNGPYPSDVTIPNVRYTAFQLRQYGEACFNEGQKLMRERCAAVAWHDFMSTCREKRFAPADWSDWCVASPIRISQLVPFRKQDLVTASVPAPAKEEKLLTNAEVIKHWEADVAMEYRDFINEASVWRTFPPGTDILLRKNRQYRLKPEPKPDLTEEYAMVPLHKRPASSDISKNLRLTFDGETGALKKAEVINPPLKG